MGRTSSGEFAFGAVWLGGACVENQSMSHKPKIDKRARLIAQSDLFAGGSVRLPQRARRLEDFIAELLAFPGRHDERLTLLRKD